MSIKNIFSSFLIISMVFVANSAMAAKGTEAGFFSMMSEFDSSAPQHPRIQDRPSVQYSNSYKKMRDGYEEEQFKLFPNEDSDVEIDIIADVNMEYESNIFQYSEDDLDEFESDGRNPAKFRDVVETDDFRTDVTVGFRVEKEFYEKRPTEFRGTVRGSFFKDNEEKNYETYHLSLRQKLSRDDIVRFSYYHVPDFYLRNFLDSDIRAYRRATFEKDSWVFRYWKRINPKLRTSFLYRLDEKEFNSNFSERDALKHTFNFKVSLPEALPNVKLSPFYELQIQDAEGEDSDGTPDDDVSYRQNGFGIRADWDITPRLRLTSSYRLDFKNYTTGQSFAVDPLHAERDDIIYELGFRLEYLLNPNVTLYLGYEFIESDADVIEDPANTSRDDVLGYKDHIVSWGAETIF